MRFWPLLLLATLVAGCGGESSTTLGSVAKNDLAIMVLPAEEVGEVANGLDVRPTSGFQDAGDVAADTLDPDDTAEDVEATGFRAGYQLDYAEPEKLAVTTEVALFGTAEEASEFVATTIGDAESLEGSEIEGGALTLESVDVAEVDGPGDTAWEATATATAGSTEISSTVVAFTIDQVAANVSMTQLGQPVRTDDVQEVARTLASRIEAVAAGDVSDTPVPVPTETTAATPQRDPGLERMVLALTDLPFGVAVKSDGYITQGDKVSFQRDFAPGNAKIGRSELIGLQSNVERVESAAAAALAVNAVSRAVKGPAGRKLFAESFAQGAGFSAESLRIDELPGEGIGDEATVLHATFDTQVGPIEAILVFMSQGRTAGQIYAAGPRGKVFADDILGLARTVAKKMEAQQ